MAVNPANGGVPGLGTSLKLSDGERARRLMK